MRIRNLIALMVALFAAVAWAEPRAGDADFPTRNGSPRHEEKVAAVRAGKYDLVLIGDSITHSMGELDGKYAPNREVWNRHFAPRRAINLGMNGQRTEEILWNLQNGELEFGKSPKVAMVLIGTNNADDRHFRRVHTPEEILAGTKAIVDVIRKWHPTTKILVLRIFPRGGDAEKSVSPPAFNSSAKCIETCRRAGELTASLADGKHVFWLDINSIFLRPDGTINTDLMWDLLHPSPAGAEAWAQAVEPMLAELMGETAPAGPGRLGAGTLERLTVSVYPKALDPGREKETTGKLVLIGTYSNGIHRTLAVSDATITARTKDGRGNEDVARIEGDRVIPIGAGTATIEAVVMREGKSIRASTDVVVGKRD